MTERLYYHDSYLLSFDARVVESVEHNGNHAVILDRTAFYPTSGGQVYDTGTLIVNGDRIPVTEVADGDDGRVVHMTESSIAAGTSVRGEIDATRRIDHIQQHTGQHVLSAAFIQLFNMPTVSFHMGAETCTIDLDTPSLTPAQMEKAELLANEVVAQDRPVGIRFVPVEEARELGLRKLPPKQTGDLRLIDIKDFDLCACGGTHVRSTDRSDAFCCAKRRR